MKVFKKAAALIFCMILVFSLAGCVPGSQGGAENIFLWPLKAVESLRDKAADVSEELADKIRDFRDNAGGQEAEEPDVSGEVKPENGQEPG